MGGDVDNERSEIINITSHHLHPLDCKGFRVLGERDWSLLQSLPQRPKPRYASRCVHTCMQVWVCVLAHMPTHAHRYVHMQVQGQ